MTETLVTLEDFQDRYTLTLDASEEADIRSALEDLSDDARSYGSGLWTTSERAPQPVKNLIMRAARRFSRNMEGFKVSRAGDEAVEWAGQGEDAGSAFFTEREIKAIRGCAGTTSLTTASVYAWGTHLRHHRHSEYVVGLVPDELSNEPIQMFNSDTEPW